MPKRIGVTCFFLFLLFAVSAQTQLNFIEVDKKSYELYERQKWEELIDYSTQVRKQGIDFFYLQVRTAIAWYNLKKYRNSAEWFLKGWENGKSFEWYQEYLYYSLVFSGRGIEALKYADEFLPPLIKKIGYATKKLSSVALEGGFSFNPDLTAQTETSLKEKANTGENYGEAYYLKNYHFESIDLSHQVAPGIILIHNFTFLGIKRKEQVDWGNKFTFPVNISQFQYYLNPLFVLGKKIYVSPSATLIWGKSDLNLGGLDANSQKIFYSSSLNYSDFIFSGSVWSHYGNFSPGTEFNLANISDENFIQVSAWLTVYPFSNTSFYLTPRVYFKTRQGNGLAYNTFGISGGLPLGPLHFYGHYLNGDMKNFIEPAGYVVANFPGKSSRKYMGSLYFPSGKKYQFVVRYLNQDIIEDYTVYSNGIKSSNLEYNYIKHTITGGISWKF